MPSLSASVPANKLKVMRQPAPSKPVARPMPGQTAAGGASAGSAGAGGASAGSAGTGAGATTPPAGLVKQGPAPPRLGATGGGFQFRPRDTVGGPMVPGAGAVTRDFRPERDIPGFSGYPSFKGYDTPSPGAGGSDIQAAIKSLRDQLGAPNLGAGQDTPTSAAVSPVQPAWQQLAGMGIGGQGSAAANKAKLAELLAARTGGGMMPPGAEPGVGAPNTQANPAVADAANAYIRRLPATISDPDGGAGGATVAGNQGPMGPGPAAQNPYMDILGRRLAGFGAGGRGGFNPGAAVQYAR